MSAARLARRLAAFALLAALPVAEARALPAVRVTATLAAAPVEGAATEETVVPPDPPVEEAAPAEPEETVVPPDPPEPPAPEGPIAADAGASAPAPVSAPAAREPAKGLVMTIAGAAVFGAIGVPLMFVGAWSTAVARSYGLHGTTGPTLIVIGALGLGGGATLFGLGLARRLRWKKWRATQPPEVAVGVGRSPLGTMFPSLTMRF